MERHSEKDKKKHKKAEKSFHRVGRKINEAIGPWGNILEVIAAIVTIISALTINNNVNKLINVIDSSTIVSGSNNNMNDVNVNNAIDSEISGQKKTMENNITPDNINVEQINVYMSVDPNYSGAPQTWEYGTIEYATSISTGDKVDLDAYIEQKVLLSYSLDGNVVIFYGQFDSEYKWDSDCILNIYDGNKIVSITEAVYDHGVLVSYNQVKKDISKRDNKDIWLLSRKNVLDDFKEGVTISYYRYDNGEYGRDDLSIDNVSIEDLKTIKDITEEKLTRIRSYYSGRTDGELYEDDTGDAYLATYSDDDQNTIVTLYQGIFKDGTFEDESEMSWEITRKDVSKYLYRKGPFVDGKSQNENYILIENMDDLNIYLDGRVFDCELRWEESMLQ